MQLPTVERRSKLKSPATNKGDGKSKTFEKSRKDFQQMWLYCCPQAIKIIEFINNECDDVRRMSLFHIQTSVLSLKGFVNANNEKFSVISNFLKQKWIENVVRVVQLHLANDRSWFDLNVNDWGIYRMSKLYRLIELIKQRMEVAVRFMLSSSLRAFVNHLCQSCEPMLYVAVDFVWGSDLVNSKFHFPHQVLSIELNFDDENEPAYTTGIDELKEKIVEMFESRIPTTHEIPQIDPYLVTQLKFEKSLRLTSIGLLEDEIQNQLQRLQCCYQICMIPLPAYLRPRVSQVRRVQEIDYP